MRTLYILAILTISLTCFFTSTFARNLPDAGRLQRELEQKPTLPKPEVDPDVEIAEPTTTAPTGEAATLLVDRFIISGNTVIPTEDIEQLLDAHSGKMHDFSSLKELTNQITALYQQRGFLTSRAYLPAQEITNNTVEINIIEGRLDSPGFTLNTPDDFRFNEELISKVLFSSLEEGQVLERSDLERGLLILNDFPGVRVKSTLIPGASAGTSELLVEPAEEVLITGSIDFDNYGNYYTGSERGGGSLQLNSPTGAGDLAGVNFTTSLNGLDYFRGFYQRPIGSSGTQLGAAFNWMDYRLGREFKDDRIEGESVIGSLYLTYPLIRSRQRNLFLLGNFDIKRLTDEVADIETGDRDIKVFKAHLAGNQIDTLYKLGFTDFNLTYTIGDLDLSGVETAFEIDQLTKRTDGIYHLIGANLSHNQYLTQHISVFAGFQGQLALNNLDSSEQFPLGGPFGVRAYPQGEAYGDSGLIATAELRYDVNVFSNHLVQGALFYDYGRTWLHHDTWERWNENNPSLENSYPLSGAGVGLNISQTNRYNIRLSYAWTIGDNEGVDANGNNSEGKDSDGQFWLQVNFSFPYNTLATPKVQEFAQHNSQQMHPTPTTTAQKKPAHKEQYAGLSGDIAESTKKIYGQPHLQAKNPSIVGEKLVLGTQPDSIELTAEASKQLNVFTKKLLAHPGVKIRIEGYIASKSNSPENIILSESRAIKVKQHLLNAGIKEHQIATIGMGNQHPVATNETYDGRKKNRRVELHIVGDVNNRPDEEEIVALYGFQNKR